MTSKQAAKEAARQAKKAAKEKAAHKIFMARSNAAYQNMRMRLGGGKSKLDLPFSVEELRREIKLAIIYGECPYALDDLTVKNFSVDHKQPVSRGGSCDLGNLEIVSARANSIKGNLARDEFCELLDLTRKWPKEAHSDIMGRLRAATNSRHRIFFKKKV